MTKKETTNSKTTKKNVKTKVKSTEEKQPVEAKEVSKNQLYLGYNSRIIARIILLLVLIAALIYCLSLSFSITNKKIIQYSEKSNIDYQVYLKENDFYKTPYLNKGMAYIASLIDKIDIKYNYAFKANENSNLDIKYKTIARLVIESQNNDKIFYEDSYVLKEEKSEELLDKKEFVLNDNVSIDYTHYNGLANKFRSKYAVNANSYLEVFLEVSEVSKEKNNYELNSQNKTILRIPLSQQEINIGLDEELVNEEKEIISEPKFSIKNPMFIVVDILLLVLIIITLIGLLKKLSLTKSKVSKYDRYINRILRGYDRLIVNVKTAPNLEEYNVIKVESFEELVDLRDNTKEPIRYFEISEHQKCEFFITNHNDLYIYVVKAVDLEDSE